MLQVSQSCNQLRGNLKDVTWCLNSVDLNVLLFSHQRIIYFKAQISSEWHQILTSSFLFGQVYTSLKSDFKAFRMHTNEHTINYFCSLMFSWNCFDSKIFLSFVFLEFSFAHRCTAVFVSLRYFLCCSWQRIFSSLAAQFRWNYSQNSHRYHLNLTIDNHV